MEKSKGLFCNLCQASYVRSTVCTILYYRLVLFLNKVYLFKAGKECEMFQRGNMKLRLFFFFRLEWEIGAKLVNRTKSSPVTR